ncbi:endonuclease domain-containing protein [Streptomyces deccanensis]|uniref:endonuclease domain-containing protein n=1 Tax=Streptomyces deccanensis TaxID=424188 RepID=UPI001EFAE404|nr:endonuclease domain-containing protein [Streptomyces deccanensis]ULR54655.1 endonuclease VII domain-containing protein [Streptomyces deccanensis]
MSERAMPGRAGGLITLGAADTLWVDLTADSAVPTASGAFTRSPAHARVGYVLLGGHVVATVRASGGRWSVPESEVRRAAAELNAVGMDRQDLVRIGPFRGAPTQECDEETPLRWRRRITGELRELGGPERAARRDLGRPYHLAGIDWRQLLVERTRDGTQRTWWLPRAVVRLLDAAEHAEAQWVQAARTRRAGAAATEPPSHPRRAHDADGRRDADGRQTASPEGPTAAPRPYNAELEGQLYSVLSRKPGTSRRVAGWACAVCRDAPAAVLDHCHEHGYVRAPVCQSCNTLERPDHLYSNDIRVANRYTRFFHTGTDDWLRHWHRCPGCRARTTLPLPHLAAWTAHIACRSLRPTHRAPRGRTPCGVLRVSWTGSQNTPRSCLLTVAVDCCPSGEHRVLARVPYREAAERFRSWLAETAPAVAAAAGPDRVDGLPAQPRPVIADTSGEGLALF